MFETAELGRKVGKAKYEKAVPGLRADLLRAQNDLQLDPKFSVVLLVNGVDGAGKGATVNLLHEWMDPRYLRAHAFGPPSDEELERPEMWRFWRLLPPKGRIGIFFGSWYSRPILDRVFERTNDAELQAALAQIVTFEQGLVDDGTLLLKFWFHLGKKAQKHRHEALRKDKKTSWKITARDRKHFELYDKFIETSERALRETSTGGAPWTIVEGEDKRYRELTVGRHVLDGITRHLAAAKRRAPRPKPRPAGKPEEAHQPSILSALELDRELDQKAYKRQYALLQGKLNRLSRKASDRSVSTVLVFEGPDAAGKGGAIRRVTRSLDARYYHVIPIAAPNDEERARHYLWRFWLHLPQTGHVTIFDRSWYGRVLVERVEGFATEAEWKRAYREIYEFEERLCERGIAVMKFWVHIDPDEQLRRFKEREKTAYKKYKITDEDYRNRERWEQYEEAVNEMVERTSTSFAPWTLIEGNNKYFARIKVMQTVCAGLERALSQQKERAKANR